MIIGIVGLGLIGGSLAKAIKQRRDDQVFGLDTNPETIEKAKSENIIDEVLSEKNIKLCDYILIALYPDDTVLFIEQYKDFFKKGAVIIDCAGTKQTVCGNVFPLAKKHGFLFIGGHPMAGVAKTGYDGSFDNMFKNASMILVFPEKIDGEIQREVERFFLSLGFKEITESSAKEHDRIIAFSSQLAHIISSAYVKSETATRYNGFSAGSFRDMTRVAWLNEQLWSRLFIDNRMFLSNEIETLIRHLSEYKKALDQNDLSYMQDLLKQGRIIKQQLNNAEKTK